MARAFMLVACTLKATASASITCTDVKQQYKQQGCCGNGSKDFDTTLLSLAPTWMFTVTASQGSLTQVPAGQKRSFLQMSGDGLQIMTAWTDRPVRKFMKIDTAKFAESFEFMFAADLPNGILTGIAAETKVVETVVLHNVSYVVADADAELLIEVTPDGDHFLPTLSSIMGITLSIDSLTFPDLFAQSDLGGSCTVGINCKGYTMLPAGVVCCSGTCKQSKQSGLIWVCPENLPKSLGESCTVGLDCQGYTGIGKQGNACCNNKCETLVQTDLLKSYWCPDSAAILNAPWNALETFDASVEAAIKAWTENFESVGIGLIALANLLMVNTAAEQSRFFQAPYMKPDYTSNDNLLGYTQLALAYCVASYHPQAKGDTDDQFFIPVFLKRPNAPEAFCTSLDDAHQISYDAASASQNSEKTIVTSNAFSALIFSHERADEQLITLAVRGSVSSFDIAGMMDPGDFSSTLHTIESIWSNWVGTDLQFQTISDSICGTSALLQAGYATSWLQSKGSALSALKQQIDAAVDTSEKVVKVLITGHSLGAALAQLIAYDVSCNKFFDQFNSSQVEFLGVITFGTPTFVFKGLDGRQQYTGTVPIEKRIQVQDCYEKDSVWSCDPVTGNIQDLDYAAPAYKGTIQVVQRDYSTDTPSCFGFPVAFWCHLLDGYMQGVQKVPKMNSVCKAANYPTT